jgi:CubicO group peptidase (beta-lactamase class C family)
MKARLLQPFGMDSSRYLWDDLLEKEMARPHGERGEPQAFRKTKVYVVSRYGSAGALKTTPADYARFMIEVMRPRSADAFRLTKKTRDEMLRTQVKVRDFKGYSVSWALGWRVVRAGQYELFGHGGGNPGYQCFAAMSLAQKSGFVIMTNADSGEKLLEALTPTALGS